MFISAAVLIPDIFENFCIATGDSTNDTSHNYKGIMIIPPDIEFVANLFLSYNKQIIRKSSKNILEEHGFGMNIAVKEALATIKAYYLENERNIRKYSIKYEIIQDSCLPFGMTKPLKFFVIEIKEVSEMKNPLPKEFKVNPSKLSPKKDPGSQSASVFVTRVVEEPIQGFYLFK